MPFAQYVEQLPAPELSRLALTGPGSESMLAAAIAWEKLAETWNYAVNRLQLFQQVLQSEYSGAWAQEMLTTLTEDISER